ncbi:LOW QUALITY PROTEIN: sodium channel modifier 1 [Notolabrus celidotus]|uniref:LOW QUALITY PROTEIN: sodium channel modifier 1 n=1 Tax=Notolabrus celidotus TaxID=1203425 RepID=UPI0014906B8A|nr:LOW QUALITY PROTEIN: sodium channel modifier 1 [Notolabrus celidotus]
MSFKREGDDKSQLNILKKRRVADLLSHYIPEDEAALMKNGRYTCLVCSYRPVFDTVDILTVHRKGKRHLEGLKIILWKESTTEDEITKRQHENYVQSEDKREVGNMTLVLGPVTEQTRKLTYHALLKTAPYNSCHRKTSTKCDKDCRTLSQNQADTSLITQHLNKKQTAALTLHHREASECTAANEESHQSVTQEEQPMTAERRKELEHYLKLKSNGWLQDRSGKWVKDDNVEFDSDEEEPPSPPSLPENHLED